MADNTNIYDFANQAGEFDIEHFELLLAQGEGIDVKQQIDSIRIYEDIYAPFITGTVIFRDTLDIPSVIGRGGKDLLDISLKTKGLKDEKINRISGLFYLYKFSEREMVGHKMQKYAFHFVSIEMMFDFKRNVSRAFRGSPEEIIEKIVKKYYPETEKELNFDSSSNQIKFISNFWSPSQCINYASKTAVSSSGDASYTFFENREGFNFKTLDTMFNIDKDKPFQIFKENDFSTNIVTEGPLAGVTERDPNKDVQIVQNVRVDTVYDFIDVYSTCGLKSRMTSYDLLKKTISTKTVSARDGSRINDHPLFSKELIDSVDPLSMYIPKHYDVTDTGNVTNSKFVQSRLSDMRIINSSKIEIDVFGRTDYTVGKVIYYASNKKTSLNVQDDPDNVIDKLYSGYYLITAISHSFTRKQHLCTIELSKEGSMVK